jgi:hypothetical protein
MLGMMLERSLEVLNTMAREMVKALIKEVVKRTVTQVVYFMLDHATAPPERTKISVH